MSEGTCTGRVDYADTGAMAEEVVAVYKGSCNDCSDDMDTVPPTFSVWFLERSAHVRTASRQTQRKVVGRS